MTMMNPTPVNIVVEDYLSEVALRRVLAGSSVGYIVGTCYSGRGYGNIRQKMSAFNNAAKGMPYVVLVDLVAGCAPMQIRQWLPIPKHPNLLCRVAVREIESWLLADRSGLASFLGIARKLVPSNPDEIPDPKECLVNLAKRSRKRDLREALAPKPNSTAKVGPDYNGQVAYFVANRWDIAEAAKNSDSLRRAVHAIDTFKPVWETGG